MWSPKFRAGKVLRAALIVSVLCGSACSKPETPTAAKPSLKVSMVQAKSTSIADVINASGTIMARDEILLGVELSGSRVAKVLVDVGATVQAGQTLLTLDSRTLEVERLQARAQLQQAKAALTVAEADARRGAELRKRGLTSERDTDQTTANLLNAQAGLDVARAGLEAAELKLSFATLKAPSDGVISARNVQTGQVVTAGAELFRMIKNNALEWRAELNEAQFLSVKLGDAVQVQTESVEVTGKVRAMDAGLQMKTRTAVIYVDLPTNSMLRAGAFAHGQISRGQKSVLLLPSSAIIKRDGFSYVFTVADGIASQRQIQTGVSAGDQIEVLGGLENGTAVVLEGAGFLADGDRVAVITAANAGATP